MHQIPELPQPIFDTLASLEDGTAPLPAYVVEADYTITRQFLLAYRHSPDTFHSYRRDVDRFLQWVYLIARMELTQIGPQDIEAYVLHCKRPPATWIATKMVARFVERQGALVPNPDWRPYVAKVTKEARQRGIAPSIKGYHLSDAGVQATLRILSTFYTFLEMEGYLPFNPVKRLRQKSRLVKVHQTQAPIRRLSEVQWDTVIETAAQMAELDPRHERTLFMMSALYGMYLRISELADTPLWTPQMNHFYKDSDDHWWFKTVGKGNKERHITVSNDMLAALKRYRASLNLSPLPSLSDTAPLIPKQKGHGGVSSTRQLRAIVQQCFDAAIQRLVDDGMTADADGLRAATVHWLRHTGISDDVKQRPREHVRDDAGHSSSATTDR